MVPKVTNILLDRLDALNVGFGGPSKSEDSKSSQFTKDSVKELTSYATSIDARLLTDTNAYLSFWIELAEFVDTAE